MLSLAIWLLYQKPPQDWTDLAPHTRPAIKTKQEKEQSVKLAKQIEKIKPWHTAEDYTKEDWLYLLKLAQSVQKTSENVVYVALKEFRPLDVRIYLLLKVVFYRQFAYSNLYGGISVGAITRLEPTKPENISDGPIDWQRGYPRFVANLVGVATGMGFIPADHYAIMKRCFSLRKIKIPAGWEEPLPDSPKPVPTKKPTQNTNPAPHHKGG